MTKSEYKASKIRDGEWAIYFHCAIGTFGPKGQTFKTKREAERKASDWNAAAAEIARQTS